MYVLPIVNEHSIGRWGNFFNEEAFGRPTDLPWKLYISPAHRPPEYRSAEFFHPAFLYESLWDLAVFGQNHQPIKTLPVKPRADRPMRNVAAKAILAKDSWGA